MGDDGFPRLFTLARRPGAYLRIATEGTITEGDVIHVEPAEQPAITIEDLVSGDMPDEVLRHIVDDHRVAAGWRHAAERALARADDRG
jgi:MOSC domain-containing protein YiiM